MKLLNKQLSDRLIDSDLGKPYQSFMHVKERQLLNWRKANLAGKKTKLTSPASIQFFMNQGFEIDQIIE